MSPFKMPSQIENKCREKGLKMTDQRQIIAQVLSESSDHPDVEAIYQRASQIDPNISLATVYRTMRLFEESGAIAKLGFRDGRARYEQISTEDHHHHLIDLQSGEIIEFQNEELEALKQKIAHELGYKLVDHTLELYGIKQSKE